jgi:hypothetical protein
MENDDDDVGDDDGGDGDGGKVPNFIEFAKDGYKTTLGFEQRIHMRVQKRKEEKRRRSLPKYWYGRTVRDDRVEEALEEEKKKKKITPAAL